MEQDCNLIFSAAADSSEDDREYLALGADNAAAFAAGAVVPFFSPRHLLDGTSATPAQVALIGTYVPRKCGIATFTSDVVSQLAAHERAISTKVYALDDPARETVYQDGVALIDEACRESYLATARAINESGADVVWLQHEFGIFGGADGELVLELVDAVAAPLVVTFHTVLSDPSPNQRRIVERLLARASRVMVMSQHGRDLLVQSYSAASELIEVIPHGAPDRPFGREELFKSRLGLAGKTVMMTFGLLGPGKGLEAAIAALPAIVKRYPNMVYRIVGATHPNLVARDGESYREGLIAQAEALGVADHIVWENRFLDTDELLDQLEACDIYVTPYPGMQQATSGTLSYAVALGKAVVSTPYVHARELLAGGVGVLVEPNSPAAIADAVLGLMDDPARLAATKARAYAAGRRTIWPEFAAATAALVRRAVVTTRENLPLKVVPGLSGFFSMCDGTGMLQHAIGVVPDRRHGYCLDDNARALMLMNHAETLTPAERMAWSSTFASFIQHAWNEDKGHFRNFMSFGREWLEDEGSDDSNGRALWVLGDTIVNSPLPDIQAWARRWFDITLRTLRTTESPRALAFGMLGAGLVLESGQGDHPKARALIERGGDLLSRLLASSRRPDWAWFEAVLGYDNPRLPQALIVAGRVTGRQDWLDEGLATLAWIAERQTSAEGRFRPVGSETFHLEYDQRPFDQQPLEAQAAIEACIEAQSIDPSERWAEHARAAYAWFFGANDRGAELADLATGRCRDGVTPRGANENCGAESILALQLSHVAIRRFDHGRAAQLRTRGRSDEFAIIDGKAGSALART